MTISTGIHRFFITCIFVLLTQFQFLKAQSKNPKLVIRIHPVFGSQKLLLSDKAYINANNDTLFIDAFKFYFTNICLFQQNKRSNPEKESYHLVDAEDSSTCVIKLYDLNDGIYTRMSFNIGVDSIKNVSGALSGDLDPIKGMYWAWNTGYIAAKLEGRSKVCKTLHNSFEYHVGGYLQPYNTLRKNELTFKELIIKTGNTAFIDLYADASEWFVSPSKIDISKLNSIVLPNANAMIMADNYSDMIKLKEVNNPK